MIRLGPPHPARVALLCAASIVLVLVPVVAPAIAAPKPVRSSARNVAKTEPAPRYVPLRLDLVTQVKRTALGDDRFHEFLAASTRKGHRTIQSFVVERRDLRTTRGRIVAVVSFSMPATEEDFPLYLPCAAPRAGASITGIAWVMSEDGRTIDQTSPVWGTVTCL